jgi:hypothetical protein
MCCAAWHLVAGLLLREYVYTFEITLDLKNARKFWWLYGCGSSSLPDRTQKALFLQGFCLSDPRQAGPGFWYLVLPGNPANTVEEW